MSLILTLLDLVAQGIVALHRRSRDDAGQATAEYALVLLGAAVVAIALITWATGSGRVGQLFDTVFDELQSRL